MPLAAAVETPRALAVAVLPDRQAKAALRADQALAERRVAAALDRVG